MDTELWFSSTVAAAAARHAVAGMWPSPCAQSTSRPSPARLSLPLPKSPASPALFVSLLSVSTSSRVNEPSRASSPALRRPALAVPRLDSSRPTLIASPWSSSVPSRARPRPIPAGIDTPRHQTPLKFRRNSGRRRTPPSGHHFHQPSAEIDSPRLPKAHALLVLARSRCFRARSTAMPSMACCCSSRAARTRPCAAPPSTPSPSGFVEPSHGRPITNLSRRRRGRRRHCHSCCCSRRRPSSGHPGINRDHLEVALVSLMLPHPSPAAGMASSRWYQAPRASLFQKSRPGAPHKN